MRGAPARAIQELACHSEIQMTQRYMSNHLQASGRPRQSPPVLRILPKSWRHFGNGPWRRAGTWSAALTRHTRGRHRARLWFIETVREWIDHRR